MKQKIYAVGTAFIALLMMGHYVLAESALQTTEGFSRYKFGSVTARLSLPGDNVLAGTEIPIMVNIQNGNDYPIVDASVYVKINKKAASQFEENVNYFEQVPDKNSFNNQDFLVDQFLALEDINLDARETKTLTFDWKVPENLASGEYSMVSFVQSAKKFNLLGLTFTEDIVGNTHDFSLINGTPEGTVEFEKNNVKLNGEPYNFIGFLESYDKNQTIKIEAPIKNTTAETQEVTLFWDTYYWDGLLSENKIKSEKETLSLSPNETKVLSYEIVPNDFPVNYFVARAEWKDSQSILNIRYNKNGQESARNNFMGLSSFPLKANQPITVFATAHAVKDMQPVFEPYNEDGTLRTENDTPKEENYSLVLNIKDEKNNVLETFSYSGEISGKVTGYQAEFTPKDNYGKVVLEAEIRNSAGKIVDKSQLIYDCQLINSQSCVSENAVIGSEKNRLKKNIYLMVFFLVMISLGLIIWRRIGGGETRGNVMRILIFAFSVAAMGFLNVLPAQALTFSSSGGDYAGDPNSENGIERMSQSTASPSQQQVKLQGWLEDRAYKSASVMDRVGSWWTSVLDVDASVTYTGKSSISDGSKPLPVGTKFTISDKTHKDRNSIWWLVKGYSIDSPPGCWVEDPSKYNQDCEYKIYEQKIDNAYNLNFNLLYRLYGEVLFGRPRLSLSTSGPVKCSPVSSGLYWNCEVISGGGNIVLKLAYEKNSGRFLYRSMAQTNSTHPDYGDREIKGEFQSELKCSKVYKAPAVEKAPAGCLVKKTGTCSQVKYCANVYGNSEGSVNAREMGSCSECANRSQLDLTLPKTTMVWEYKTEEPKSPNNETVSIVLSGLQSPFSGRAGAFTVRPANPAFSNPISTTYQYNYENGTSLSTNVDNYFTPEAEGNSALVAVHPPSISGQEVASINFDNCNETIIEGAPFGELKEGGESCRIVVKYKEKVAPGPSSIDLSINGQKGTLNVEKGDPLGLEWTPKNVENCTGAGAGFGGSQNCASPSQETISATTSSNYYLTGRDINDKSRVESNSVRVNVCSGYICSPSSCADACKNSCGISVPRKCKNACAPYDEDPSQCSSCAPCDCPPCSQGSEGWKEVAP